MGIEVLGESLLSNIRSQRESDAKRRQKEADRAKLMQLVGKGIATVGNKYLQDKAQEFLNSEKNRTERRLLQNSMYNANQIDAWRKEAEAHKGGVEGYLLDYATNQQMVGLTPLAEQGYSQLELKAIARSKAMENLETYRKQWDNLIKTHDEFKTDGVTSPEVYAELAKAKTPVNIKQALVHGAVDLLTGKDRQVSIFDSFITSGQIKTANELNSAYALFNKTRNAPVAIAAFEDAQQYDIGLEPKDLDIQKTTIKTQTPFGEESREVFTMFYRGKPVGNYDPATAQTVSQPTPQENNLISTALGSGNEKFQNFLKTREVSWLSQYAPALPEDVVDGVNNYVKSMGISDLDTQKAKLAALTPHGIAYKLSGETQAKYNLSARDADMISYAMVGLNQNMKDDFDGLSLLYGKSGLSPLLALAAYDTIQKNSEGRPVLRKNLGEEIITTIVDRPDFLDNIKQLNVIDQNKVLTWASGFEIFANPINGEGDTLLSVLQAELGIENVKKSFVPTFFKGF